MKELLKIISPLRRTTCMTGANRRLGTLSCDYSTCSPLIKVTTMSSESKPKGSVSKIDAIKSKIASYPDFPKPGVLFRDIFPVFKDPPLLKELINLLCIHVKQLNRSVDILAALESRGFLFAVPMSLQLGIPFVPIRKKGKLPGKTTSMPFTLEYGNDSLEIQEDAILPGQNVVIVDDLLATGGTMKAACHLIQAVGGNVIECTTVMELVNLNGRDGITLPIFSLIQY